MEEVIGIISSGIIFICVMAVFISPFINSLDKLCDDINHHNKLDTLKNDPVAYAQECKLKKERDIEYARQALEDAESILSLDKSYKMFKGKRTGYTTYYRENVANARRHYKMLLKQSA